MPWLRLRADQRASHCRRASRSTSTGSGLVSMSTGPPGSTSDTSLRHTWPERIAVRGSKRKSMVNTRLKSG